ncbi:hypothetical protein A2U01_0107224, partial [Trifolium medium]|nr:hypothetical protein [Trifolium medium]
MERRESRDEAQGKKRPRPGQPLRYLRISKAA